MREKLLIPLWAGLMIIAVNGMVAGGQIADKLLMCSKISADADRLECYDRIVKHAEEEPQIDSRSNHETIKSPDAAQAEDSRSPASLFWD